jgi:hypothetical protein
MPSNELSRRAAVLFRSAFLTVDQQLGSQQRARWRVATHAGPGAGTTPQRNRADITSRHGWWGKRASHITAGECGSEAHAHDPRSRAVGELAATAAGRVCGTLHPAAFAAAACLGALLLISSIEVTECDQSADMMGSVAIHEWSSREWSPIAWSSNSKSSADEEPIASADSGELQEDLVALSQRLWWYVTFAELFRLHKSADAHRAVDKAALLMQNAVAWRDQGLSTRDGSGKQYPRRGWLRFGLLRRGSEERQNDDVAQPSEPPYTELTWVEAPRSQGLALVCVTPSENVAVVAVRGSVNIRNILSALQVWPTPTEKGIGVSLHSGFAQVADEMMVKIEPLLHKGMKIHLTGHSLGGAVSTILALRLKAKGYDISQVVAFGMPLVVWAGDQRELPLDIPLLRVEHPLDPVVHFPGEITGVRASFLSYDSCASAVLRNRHTARCRRRQKDVACH